MHREADGASMLSRPTGKNLVLQRPSLVYQFHPDGMLPGPGWVFVFGASVGGQHTKGAQRVARNNYRAVMGIEIGPTGDAYAVTTSDARHQRLGLQQIAHHVRGFIEYASANPMLSFFVTAVGTGPTGYSDAEVAPLFAGAPPNCSFPSQWQPWFHQPKYAQPATPP